MTLVWLWSLMDFLVSILLPAPSIFVKKSRILENRSSVSCRTPFCCGSFWYRQLIYSRCESVKIEKIRKYSFFSLNFLLTSRFDILTQEFMSKFLNLLAFLSKNKEKLKIVQIRTRFWMLIGWELKVIKIQKYYIIFADFL